MEYTLVNLGIIHTKEKGDLYALDIAISSSYTILKRVFIQEKTYKVLQSLFNDRYDMLCFDLSKYIIIEPNYKGEFQLKIFEELIQAI